MKTTKSNPRKLEVRLARASDVPGIVSLVDRAYDKMAGYSSAMVRAQINNYPEGQFVALYEGTVVGYCASMRLDEPIVLNPHTWSEITNNGFASRHDVTGDWLYGFEMCVDPALRGLRLGQRLYDARKALAERLALKGIVLGGRLPGYVRNRRKVADPADYVRQVQQGTLRDTVVGFQLRNGLSRSGF